MWISTKHIVSDTATPHSLKVKDHQYKRRQCSDRTNSVLGDILHHGSKGGGVHISGGLAQDICSSVRGDEREQNNYKDNIKEK